MVQKPKLNLAKRNAPGFAERVFVGCGFFTSPRLRGEVEAEGFG
jgi:hypothetical protein